MPKKATTIWKCDFCPSCKTQDQMPLLWVDLSYRGSLLCESCLTMAVTLLEAHRKLRTRIRTVNLSEDVLDIIGLSV